MIYINYTIVVARHFAVNGCFSDGWPDTAGAVIIALNKRVNGIIGIAVKGMRDFSLSCAMAVCF
jgi:hypothetical protein